MRDLYLWQVPYVNALVETDASVKELRIYEAIAAIEQRLLSPIAPGCSEGEALAMAQKHLLQHKAEALKRGNGHAGNGNGANREAA